MTSQHLMMNYLGVALASDSAVTMGSSGRTYNTVNKIFSLSGRQPVAFMVSNAANYIPAGVSWERVFGLYREYRRGEELNKLTDYVHDLKKFITSHESLIVPEVNDIAIQSDLISEFTKVVKPAEQREKMSKATGWTAQAVWEETDLTEYFDVAIVKRIDDLLKQTKERIQVKIEGEESEEWTNHVFKVRKRHKSNIEKAAKEFCKRHKCDQLKSKVSEIFLFHLCEYSERLDWRARSKLVIAGFGSSEMKPTLCSFEIGSDIGNGPFGPSTRYYIRNLKEYADPGKWIKEENTEDSTENVWSTTGFSQGYAQIDNMDALLTGVHPQTRRNLLDYTPSEINQAVSSIFLDSASEIQGIGKSTLAKISENLTQKSSEINKAIWNSLNENLWAEYSYRKNQFDSVTANVPVDEMSRFVEILVSLEAQVSHYLRDIRSVGGPIDVATVTKEDGFLWVKSKKRVDSQLNPKQQKVTRNSANLI